MTTSAHKYVLTLLALVVAVYAFNSSDAQARQEPTSQDSQSAAAQKTVGVQYLEVVTPEVEATCKTLAKIHGVSFGKPIPGYGFARTATLRGGGMIGVRAPLRSNETPVVRPYVLVDDINAAWKEAKESGAELAHPPYPIPGHGKFAIYILGGIEHGLWQN